MKKIIILLLVIVFITTGIVIYIISKTGGNNSTAETRTDSIEKWTYNIPLTFKEVKSDGPWYEKNYSDDKKTSLKIGYYEPNGIDNRSDIQIFNEDSKGIKGGLKQTYGDGKLLSEKRDSDGKYYEASYQTKTLTILTKNILKNKIWYCIRIEIPVGVNSKNYENVLDGFKAK